MRTLKKTLALVLVVAMVLSFGVIGAYADFTDVKADNEYKEAIDVMSAIGVINGMTATTFDPNGSLTREQAAKIIAYMLLGPTNAELISTATSQKFNDVEQNRWSAGYIEYCVNVGILNGVGDNKFDPEGKLTTAAFTKMLLCALGYSAANEGFTGTGWAIKVASIAVSAGVKDDNIVISETTPITRAEAMQLAYKTLKATCVQYKGGSTIEVNGATIVQGATREELENKSSEYRTGWTYTGTGSSDDTKMQFVEKYFPKLKLTSSTSDAFGRPAHKWVNNKENVGTYADEAIATFTASTKAADVNNALSGYYLAVTDHTNTANVATVKVNNVNTMVNDDYLAAALYANTATGANLVFAGNETIAAAIAGETANGKLVEVYADDSSVITRIVTVTYTVGTVSNVSSNATRTSYTLKPVNGTGVAYIDYVSDATDDTIVIDGSIAKGDYVTYAVVGGTAYVYPTTDISGTQSSYNARNSTITVSGSTYTVGTGVRDQAINGTDYVAMGDFANSSNTARYIFDKYGYAVATTATADYSDYAYAVGAYGTVSSSVNGSTPSAQLKVVLEDGSVKTYDLKLTKLTASSSLVTTSTNASNTYCGATVQLAAGDYVIEGTSIIVYDASETTWNNTSASKEANTAVNTLLNKALGYTVSNNTITVKMLVDANTVAISDGIVSAASLNSTIAYNTNKYTVNTDNNVLVSNNTKFVVYNSDKGTAVVYTGATGLPSTTTAQSGVAVLKGSGAKVGTASVIFVNTASGLSGDVVNYAYINASDVDVVAGEDGNVYNYNAYLPTGERIVLTADSPVNGNGVFNYTTANAVSGSALTANQFLPAATAYAITAQGSSMIQVNGLYYNITDETVVVYVNTDLTEYDGNQGYVVLALDSSKNVTNNVAVIYVTAD